MTRPTRISQVVPHLPHHVICRGNNRRRLFSYASCYSRYLRDLGGAAERHECAIHALTLMTNHVHLVITPPTTEALSACLKSVNQRYAVHRNRARAGSGKVFEERFDSIAIESEAQLAATIAYAELNAVRAGLHDDADAHPWSTYRLHSGEADRSIVPPWLWTPSSWWLALGRTGVARGKAYRAWVAETRARGDSIRELQRVADAESASRPYARRLERPDRSRASEELASFGIARDSSRGSRQKP